MKNILIETTCNLVDRKLVEMDIAQSSEPVRFAFMSSRVESFREVVDPEKR